MSFLVNDQINLIVMAGDVKIDNHKYKETYHKKCKMVPFNDVEALTGHEPGGVCPFGVKEGVNIYLDDSLKRFNTVFPAAGSAHTAIEVSINELEKVSHPKAWVDVTKQM
jgi:prolyl-tRNA editing enzyme YbaK/EbsC (Cys-tRNA(Pro) deacylase)